MIYVRKKSVPKSNGRKFFYTVFFIIIIYLLGYFINFFSQRKTNLMAVEYTESDDPQIFSGIIIRDEKIYRAKKAGAVLTNLHNLDIAKKNSIVCNIYDKDSVKKLDQDLKEINDDILDMQKNRVDISIFKDDIKNARNQIQEIIDNNIYLCSQNDLGKINNFSDAIKKNLELRNQILLTENRGNIKEMDEKKLAIEKQIKKNIDPISAQQTGLVSYFLDGFEEIYKPDKIENITNQQIKIKSQSNEISDNIIIKADMPVFKIIESNDWYIVCCVRNNLIKDLNLSEGDSKIIYLEDLESDNEFRAIDFDIYKIWPQNKNKSYLALHSRKFIQDYIKNRNIKFKFQDTKRYGFKIPVSAIDKKNLAKLPKKFNLVTKTNEGYKVTKKKDKNNSEAISINIYDSDENYYYVDGLNINDSLVFKDQENKSDKIYKIKEAKKIRGIYLANTGVAEFKKIDYDEEIPDAGFIILDPKKNTYLKVNDRIVINLEDIKDGEKIVKQ